MIVDVFNLRGEKVGRSIDLNDSVFGIEPNDHCIYLDVKQYQNNWRQGTAKAKQRNEIHGSTKKLRKQKGGGGARVGSIKNPTFRGGGRMHGPQPRDYGFKLNKKVKQLARRSALSYKIQADQIRIVEDFNFETPKTKEFIKMLSAFNIADKKTLTVMDVMHENVAKSARNIPNVNVLHSGNINTYQILNAESIIMFEGAVQPIVDSLS